MLTMCNASTVCVESWRSTIEITLLPMAMKSRCGIVKLRSSDK